MLFPGRSGDAAAALWKLEVVIYSFSASNFKIKAGFIDKLKCICKILVKFLLKMLYKFKKKSFFLLHLGQKKKKKKSLINGFKMCGNDTQDFMYLSVILTS